MPISKKRLTEIASIGDGDIDMSDSPELDDEFFSRSVLTRPGEGVISSVKSAFKAVPAVSVSYARTGRSKKHNELGMRVMQERAFERRGEQYLLIKSPPASGKSRALMFIALDKLHNQEIKKAIIVVPEKSIGASFYDEPLSDFGFYWDWQVASRWNLCDAPGEDGGKVSSVEAFLDSDDRVLVCTHATFRFAVERFGVSVFDDCLIAVDEFHHVSANPDNKLGALLGEFIERDKVHIVAMTGSYFRGDAVAVLNPADEAKFDTVTYTYYEQLNGYEYLKNLDIGYCFYSGRYSDEILDVLDPQEKTIVYIPNVNSRESSKDKIKEVEHIISELGDWRGTDPETGFHRVATEDGTILKVADLVDDESALKRDKVLAALRRPEIKHDRDHVDIIIALGMAKEGFDWVWCEHALTVGYRSSLTEIIQIIGRATRDAKGKTRARFTNLIAEPDASEESVTDAVNDTLKAIAASLLMEQVLAPKFEFTPKTANSGPVDGFDYGEKGYNTRGCNVGFNESTGELQMEINGLVKPKSDAAIRICKEDLNELIAPFIQDKTALERGLFDEEVVAEELTQIRMGKIVRDKYPQIDEHDQESIRQHAIAAFTLNQQGKQPLQNSASGAAAASTAFVDGIRKYAMDVRELDIDLIDRINPFSQAYEILAKSMDENNLKQVKAAINSKKIKLTETEARALVERAIQFMQERGRRPSITANDAWERRLAEGIEFLMRMESNG